MNVSRPTGPKSSSYNTAKSSAITQKGSPKAEIEGLFGDPFKTPSLSKRQMVQKPKGEQPKSYKDDDAFLQGMATEPQVPLKGDKSIHTRVKFKGFLADIFFNNRSNQLNAEAKEAYKNSVDDLRGRLADNSLSLKQLKQEISKKLEGSALSVEKFTTLLLHDTKVEMHSEVRKELIKLHGQHLADRFTPLHVDKIENKLADDGLKTQRNALLEVIDYVAKNVDPEDKNTLKGIRSRVSDRKVTANGLKSEMRGLGSALQTIASQDTHKYSKKLIKSFIDIFAQMKSAFVDCFRANVPDSFPKALIMSFYAMAMEFLNVAIVELRDGKALTEGVRANLIEIGEAMHKAS